MQTLSPQDIDEFLKSGWFLGTREGLCVVAWGAAKKAARPEDGVAQFYAPDFYLENKSAWWSFAKTAVVTRASLSEGLKPFAEQPRLDLKFAEPDFAEFTRAFQKVQSDIARQTLSKAVPVVFAHTNATITKAMRAFFVRGLLERATVPTPYGFMAPTQGLLGASPEILFDYEATSGVLKTVALAGTRKSSEEKAQPLLADKKECHEHALVVQGLRERLATFDKVEVSSTYVWDLGPISHLRTDFQFQLEPGVSSTEIFTQFAKLLHPTAALGVAPVSVDWKILKTYEGPVERQRFGAPFGFVLPNGDAKAVVAIRNIQWNEDGEVLLGTGCGVVEGSDLNREWQELQLKRRSVGALLGL